MKIFFSKKDLKRLKQLDEKQLYVLNCELLQRAMEIKRIIFLDESIVQDVVQLAETAAKEISIRKNWSPISSNGKYSKNGISYYTNELKHWLRITRQSGVVCDDSFLNDFNFWNELLQITGA